VWVCHLDKFLQDFYTHEQFVISKKLFLNMFFSILNERVYFLLFGADLASNYLLRRFEPALNRFDLKKSVVGWPQRCRYNMAV